MKNTLSVLCLVSIVALFGCEPASDPSSPSSSSSETSVTESLVSSSEASSSSVITHIDFPHNPAGQLKAGSGGGYADRANWAPGMCFPMADEAYANSQVHNKGGNKGPAGSQCDASNYSYPWSDNFCETRSWTNPFCANGQGHQGQDIRPKTCEKDKYWAVAAESGTIVMVGSYTVALMADAPPHRIYRYLHLKSTSLRVKENDKVVRGQKIGLVSNNMGSSPTTIHLHYEIRLNQQETAPDGTLYAAQTFVPPYTALVDAYQRKLAGDCPTVE